MQATERKERSISVGVRFWALSAAVFGIGTYVSSLFFPGPFDWRYELISTLLSYKDNPRGFVIATSALLVAPLLMIPVFKELSRALGDRGARLARTARVIGITGLSVAAIVGIEKMLFARLTNRVHKLHEMLAAAAFVCLMTAGAMYGRLYWRTPGARWMKALTFALVLPAPIGALASQWYLRRYRPDLGWVGGHWKELDIPILLSFAIWQWLFVVSAYSLVFVFLRTVRPPRQEV